MTDHQLLFLPYSFCAIQFESGQFETLNIADKPKRTLTKHDIPAGDSATLINVMLEYIQTFNKFSIKNAGHTVIYFTVGMLSGGSLLTDYEELTYNVFRILHDYERHDTTKGQWNGKSIIFESRPEPVETAKLKSKGI